MSEWLNMNIFIKGVLILTTVLLASCGGFDAVRDATIRSSGNTGSSSGNNANTGNDTKCFEPNVLKSSSVSVIYVGTVEVIPLSRKIERVRLLGIDAPESKQDYELDS